MHPLLARQLKSAHQVEQVTLVPVSAQWQALLDMVEQAYNDSDADRALVQRSIEIASTELVERNQQLVLQNMKHQVTQRKLRQTRDDLEANVVHRTAELCEAKETAERLKEHFHLLLNSTGEGIYGIDIDGKCTFANAAAARLLGYRVEEMIGQNMHDLVHYRHADGSAYDVNQCPIYRSLHMDHSCAVEEDTFWTMEQKPLLVQYSSHSMHANGKVVGSVIAFSDISARKLVELELRQAKELAERASQAKSEFLARMSHEIRTPLNGVVGMIDQLARSSMTPQQQRYTSLAKLAAESLMSVINDILDFSKIEAGKIQIESDPFDFRQMVEDLVQLFNPVASNKQLELTCVLPEDMPPRLMGDSNRIRQVLTNLIGNAIKFTAKGSVQVRVTLTAGDATQCSLFTEVIDSGPGVPADRMDMLFQRFSQLDSSITRQYGGTGLGLAICKKLIELMGGQIGVRSENSSGSTFWFALTLATPNSPTNGVEADLKRALERDLASAESNLRMIRGLHLLVAEDNEMNQFVTQETLKHAGCTSDMANDGLEAVESFKRRNYDAILMDCQMPDVDGLEATRRIRQIERQMGSPLRIPIIALTAEALSGDRDLCVAAGMDGYVSKPISANALFAELARLVGRRRIDPPPRHSFTRSTLAKTLAEVGGRS